MIKSITAILATAVFFAGCVPIILPSHPVHRTTTAPAPKHIPAKRIVRTEQRATLAPPVVQERRNKIPEKKYDHRDKGKKVYKKYDREKKKKYDKSDRKKKPGDVRKPGKKVKKAKKPHPQQRFSKSERRQVRGYYGNLPRGLQKKVQRGGSLPHGWRKKVVVGKVMPTLYIKRSVPLPAELERTLPPLPHDVLRLHLEHKLILINRHNRLILDILDL